jgi:hypothetical protein
MWPSILAEHKLYVLAVFTAQTSNVLFVQSKLLDSPPSSKSYISSVVSELSSCLYLFILSRHDDILII